MTKNIDGQLDEQLDEQLASLAASVPAPRRNDAAFARSVADGVRTKKTRAVFMFPLAAATTAAIAVFAVMHPAASTASTTSHDAGTSITLASNVPTPHTTSTLLDPIADEEDSPFALPSLEGSSDEELAFLDRALDQRLHTRNQ